MPLEQRDKERAAIGASIGANCRPWIGHHLVAVLETGVGAKSHPLLHRYIGAGEVTRAWRRELPLHGSPSRRSDDEKSGTRTTPSESGDHKRR